MKIQFSQTSNLYERDYVEWLEATSKHFKNREFESLDL